MHDLRARSTPVCVCTCARARARVRVLGGARARACVRLHVSACACVRTCMCVRACAGKAGSQAIVASLCGTSLGLCVSASSLSAPTDALAVVAALGAAQMLTMDKALQARVGARKHGAHVRAHVAQLRARMCECACARVR
eukprot:6193875-Pleurochrysis_carterae.AAC.1